MSFLQKNQFNATEILLCASSYLILFYLNQYLFHALEDTRGVNWIFIPSGLRVCLTLIFGLNGAIGLIVGAFVINYFDFYGFEFIDTIVISIICGAAPLMARYIVLNNLKVSFDLSNISFQQLIQSICIYGLLSSGMHQLWFMLRNLETEVLQHSIAMFIGDVIGGFLFFVILKSIIYQHKKKKNPA
jgi:hypothetical protein